MPLYSQWHENHWPQLHKKGTSGH